MQRCAVMSATAEFLYQKYLYVLHCSEEIKMSMLVSEVAYKCIFKQKINYHPNDDWL